MEFHLLFCGQPEDREDGVSFNYAAGVGTIGRNGLPVIPGTDDMMSEMAKRLRERRIKTDNPVSLHF